MPLLETVRCRVELSLARTSDSDDNDTRPNGETAVRRDDRVARRAVNDSGINYLRSCER